MKKQFENISIITNRELFDTIAQYEESILREATETGALELPDANNEYTREIARIGTLLAQYESTYMTFQTLKFKSPLVVEIEEELKKQQLKQREAAKLLGVKESTFSQVIRGKRPVSMQMAKRLYKEFDIDPKLILEFA